MSSFEAIQFEGNSSHTQYESLLPFSPLAGANDVWKILSVVGDSRLKREENLFSRIKVINRVINQFQERTLVAVLKGVELWCS